MTIPFRHLKTVLSECIGTGMYSPDSSLAFGGAQVGGTSSSRGGDGTAQGG